MVLAICYSSFMTWLIFASVILGIASSKFTAEGKWITFVFDILSYGVYIYICLIERYYGELALSVFVIIIHLISLFEWKKNDKNNHVLIRKLGGREVSLSLLISLIGLVIYSTILFYAGSEYPILNALSSVCYLVGNYYAFRRSSFQFFGYIGYEVVFVSLWILSAAGGNLGSLLFLVGGLSEMVFQVSGIFEWNKAVKYQKKA